MSLRFLAVATFPIWEDTTAQEAWALCEGEGREDPPDVIGWANALVCEIDGEERTLLLTL